MCSVSNSLLADSSLIVFSIKALAHGAWQGYLCGVVQPALLEDGIQAVRVHLRLLTGLGKCNVMAQPGEAGADHEQ